MSFWEAKIPLLQLQRQRSLCQKLWSVNNLCLDPRVCLSWWGAALLSAINGLEQFCWLCYRGIVQSSSLNYTLSERKRKERTAELDVNWSTDKDVKVYLRSRMVESSEVSLLRRRKNKCCWCPAESRNMWSVWRSFSLKNSLLHSWESVIQNWCEKFNKKTWAEILNQVSKRYPAEADLAWIAMREQENIGQQEQEPEGSKYYTGVKFFNKCPRP